MLACVRVLQTNTLPCNSVVRRLSVALCETGSLQPHSPHPLPVGQGLLIHEVSRSHWHTTFGRTPLDEWSARRRDLYLTIHNTHNREEPTVSANERPQTAWPQGPAVDTVRVSNKDCQQQSGWDETKRSRMSHKHDVCGLSTTLCIVCSCCSLRHPLWLQWWQQHVNTKLLTQQWICYFLFADLFYWWRWRTAGLCMGLFVIISCSVWISVGYFVLINPLQNHLVTWKYMHFLKK